MKKNKVIQEGGEGSYYIYRKIGEGNDFYIQEVTSKKLGSREKKVNPHDLRDKIYELTQQGYGFITTDTGPKGGVIRPLKKESMGFVRRVAEEALKDKRPFSKK
jgi:hypothetical protein